MSGTSGELIESIIDRVAFVTPRDDSVNPFSYVEIEFISFPQSPRHRGEVALKHDSLPRAFLFCHQLFRLVPG